MEMQTRLKTQELPSSRPLMRHIYGMASAELSDDTLLRKFKTHGDALAGETIVGRHIHSVYAVCRRLLWNEQDAADATQATFVVFAQKASTLPSGESLGPWLRGVAFKICTKARCRQARQSKCTGAQTPMADAFPDPRAPDPPEIAALRELAEMLEREIADLPGLLAEPFRLCHLEGFSREAAARKLGYSVPTLQRHLAAARSRLERRLVAAGYSLTGLLAACGLSQAKALAAAPGDLVAKAASLVALYASGKLTASLLPHGVALLLNAAVNGRTWTLLAALVTVVGMSAAGAGLAICVLPLDQSQTAAWNGVPGQVSADMGEPRPMAAEGESQLARWDQTLREKVAPRVLAALRRLGGEADLREARIDPTSHRAHLVADWRPKGFRPATVDLRYEIHTRQWELRTDFYNGVMQTINPERPIVLIRMLGFEWGPKLPELKEMEEAFHELEPQETANQTSASNRVFP